MRLIRPLIENFVLLLIIIVSAFFLFTALPADPIRSMLGVNVSEEVARSLRSDFGLDQPIWIQFRAYLSNLASLDLGISFVTRRPVSADVFPSLGASFTYAGLALLFAICYSILATFTTWISHPIVGRSLQAIHATLVSIPGLIIAIAVGIIFFHFNILGFIDDIRTRQVLTAAIVLSVYPSAVLSQILIHQIAEVSKQPFTLASRSYGFTRNQLFAIVFKSSYLPWLAQLSNIAAALLAGSIVVEYVFSLPGLGRLIQHSVIRSDYPMLQGIVLATSISYILFNLFIESVYRYLMIGRRS